MKTTLSKLMIDLAQMQNDYTNLKYSIVEKATNVKTIELDGKEQMLEEHPDFTTDFDKLNELTFSISHIKGVISKMNNTMTLENGMTIQEALILLGNLRSFLSITNSLAEKNSSKVRHSENTHSYFLCKELNYDKEDMKRIVNQMKEDIRNIESEISELNSTEFELN